MLCVTEYESLSKGTKQRLVERGNFLDLERIDYNDYEKVTSLFVKLGYILDKKFLVRFKNLKCIITPTTALTHIDQEYCEFHKIKIISLQGHTDFLKNIPATAEFTWLAILALVRNYFSAISDTKKNWRRDRFRGHDVHGKKIGIVGYGRIGKMICKYASAFGLQIYVVDVDGVFVPKNFKSTLTEIFQNCDIISVHINYTPENEKFFNSKLFNLTQNGFYFINTSRGELICDQSLINALKTNKILGAHVDVLREENMTTKTPHDSILHSYPDENNRLIISPHIGGATFESTSKTESFVLDLYNQYEGNRCAGS